MDIHQTYLYQNNKIYTLKEEMKDKKLGFLLKIGEFFDMLDSTEFALWVI